MALPVLEGMPPSDRVARYPRLDLARLVAHVNRNASRLERERRLRRWEAAHQSPPKSTPTASVSPSPPPRERNPPEAAGEHMPMRPARDGDIRGKGFEFDSVVESHAKRRGSLFVFPPMAPPAEMPETPGTSSGAPNLPIKQEKAEEQAVTEDIRRGNPPGEPSDGELSQAFTVLSSDDSEASIYGLRARWFVPGEEDVDSCGEES